MGYNITILDNHSIGKKKYFFDANIWLMILKPKMQPSQKELKYLDFFEKFKISSHHPRIVVPALLISEVVNRYLREVGMEKFKRDFIKKNSKTEINKGFYKEHYRKSEQFKIDYELLCDEIKSYSNFYELISDGFGEEFKSKHLLSSPPQGLDFNDHYYYLLAKKRAYTILTDDIDFFVEDVEIITLNSNLYQKVKDNIKPKTE